MYRIVAISLGTPPSTFTWEYYDKSKNYKKVEGLTPLKFYTEYIKPVFNVKDKVCGNEIKWSVKRFSEFAFHVSMVVNGTRYWRKTQAKRDLFCLLGHIYIFESISFNLYLRIRCTIVCQENPCWQPDHLVFTTTGLHCEWPKKWVQQGLHSRVPGEFCKWSKSCVPESANWSSEIPSSSITPRQRSKLTLFWGLLE